MNPNISGQRSAGRTVPSGARRGAGAAPFCLATLGMAAATAACGGGTPSTAEVKAGLTHRAYVVARESDQLTVIDLDRLEVVGRVRTGGVQSHMAELSDDFSKVFVSSPGTDRMIVVDARSLAVTTQIPLGRAPTHMSLSRDGSLLAIVEESENAVSFVDPVRETEVKRLSGFYQPHFVRWAPDGRSAYVANIGAHHLTRVDVATLDITGRIGLDTFAGPGVAMAPGETGFADAQIDATGQLYAADRAAGQVLVYDTATDQKRLELSAGVAPWIVYAEHPFAEIPRRHLVPNLGDETVSTIHAADGRISTSLPGDQESYGVNYSPLAPDHAFIMNRVREDVAVVDTARGVLLDRIPVGGTTETAATTPDGKWIVAAVSSANQVVVIDAVTHAIVKRFDDVGVYPWSVTIPNGQNYCH